jgi:hypothetical protein
MLLFLWKKSNQKSHPKTNTARFRDCSLIGLLYCCDFNICNSTLSYTALKTA